MHFRLRQTRQLLRNKKPGHGRLFEKIFLLNAANMYLSIIALPSAKGNFAFQADNFDFKNYNESQVIQSLSFLIRPTGIS
jgi:hypothetical protein